MVAVAHRLEVPRPVLVVNQVTSHFNPDEVKTRVAQTYHCEVAAALPHSDDLLALASGGIFALRFPGHPFTALLQQTAAGLVE